MKKKLVSLAVVIVLLVSAVIPAMAADGDSRYGREVLTYRDRGDGTVIITGASDSVIYDNTPLVIPDNIDGKPVTAIGNGAFQYCRSQQIICPSTLEVIEESAFKSARFRSIELSNSLRQMGTHVFEDCRNLESITLPESLTKIPECTFSFATSLRNVYFPASLNSIDYKAFEGCKALESIVLPAQLRQIGDYAFFRCSGLRTLDIPGGVKSISSCAFANCEGLESVILQTGVSSIQSSAFRDCAALNSITIPVSMRSIGISAFRNCWGLNVFYQASENEWNQIRVSTGNDELLACNKSFINANPTTAPTTSPSQSPTLRPTSNPMPVETPIPTVAPSPTPATINTPEPTRQPPVMDEPAQLKQNSNLAVRKLGDNYYLFGLTVKKGAAVTVADIKREISIPTGWDISIQYPKGYSLKNDNDIVPTGAFYYLMKDGTRTQSTYVVVKGDVSGTGQMNIAQVIKVAQHVAGRDELKPPYLYAANSTGKVTIGDVVTIASLLK